MDHETTAFNGLKAPLLLLVLLLIFTSSCSERQSFEHAGAFDIFTRELQVCAKSFSETSTIKECAVTRSNKALAAKGFDDSTNCIEKVGKFWLKQQIDIQEGRTTASLSQKLLERFIAIIAKEC